MINEVSKNNLREGNETDLKNIILDILIKEGEAGLEDFGLRMGKDYINSGYDFDKVVKETKTIWNELNKNYGDGLWLQ